jgi:hypothetical protein
VHLPERSSFDKGRKALRSTGMLIMSAGAMPQDEKRAAIDQAGGSERVALRPDQCRAGHGHQQQDGEVIGMESGHGDVILAKMTIFTFLNPPMVLYFVTKSGTIPVFFAARLPNACLLLAVADHPPMSFFMRSKSSREISPLA